MRLTRAMPVRSKAAIPWRRVLVMLCALCALCACSHDSVIYSGSARPGSGGQTARVSGGVVELTTPESVPAANRYQVAGVDTALIAYSLKGAAAALADGSAAMPARSQLGGINVVLGAIVDPATQDVIIVGRQDPRLPAVTLDELATIFRSTFVWHKAPFISIDPPKEQSLVDAGTMTVRVVGPVTRDVTIPLVQTVRTDGGVADTQVGANMIDADFRMKLILFSLLRSGVTEVDEAARRLFVSNDLLLQQNSSDRYEFYPDANGIYVDRLFVVLAGGGLLSVKTARESGAPELATAQTRFAGALSAHTRDVALRHSTIGSVYVYSQLHALAVGLEAAGAASYVAPFLARQPPIGLATVRQIPAITADVSLSSALNPGLLIEGLAWITQVPSALQRIHITGGVLLDGYSVSSTLRQNGLTLRSAILAARPDAAAVTWTTPSGGGQNARDPGALIAVSDVASELRRMRGAAAAGLVETVLTLADRLFHATTDAAAIRSAARIVALTAVLTEHEQDGARLLSEIPDPVRAEAEMQSLLNLLQAAAAGPGRSLANLAATMPPSGEVAMRMIWAMSLQKSGQLAQACGVVPELAEEFANSKTVELALECADLRQDAPAMARYLAITQRAGVQPYWAGFYRAELERLAGRPDVAAAWYYSYLAHEPKAEHRRVAQARAVLAAQYGSDAPRRFEAPPGYGLLLLLREGQWRGSLNGRLVTSPTGTEIYGRLGSGEFLVVPLPPGRNIVRLLGSLSVAMHKELIVDIRPGEITTFKVVTLELEGAETQRNLSAAQKALSCAQSVSGNAGPMASGGQLIGIALGCSAVGVVKRLGDLANEGYDDLLYGPSLEAIPVAAETWRQIIPSMRPAGPWGKS